MNRFETSPHFTTLPGVALKDRPFILTQPLVYRTDVLPDLPRIEMPVGFRSDLATVPRFFRRLFSVAGWWRDAAWPHDFCCDPVDAAGNPIPYFCNHKEAAAIFYEALENSIELAPILEDTEKKRKMAASIRARMRRVARFLAWCVRVGGPEFEREDLDKESQTGMSASQGESQTGMSAPRGESQTGMSAPQSEVFQ